MAGAFQPGTKTCCQSSGQGRRGCNADLLAEDGPQAEFEDTPCSRDAQSGMPFHDRAQEHGQMRFLEQSLGEEQSLGLQDFDRSESESLLQQASHLPAAETRQRSQFLDGFAVRRPALQLAENSLFQ